MEVNLYVIHDTLAERSGPIFEAYNDEVAVRAFHRIVAKEDIAEDCELTFLGTLDHETNELKAFSKRILEIDLKESE